MSFKDYSSINLTIIVVDEIVVEDMALSEAERGGTGVKVLPVVVSVGHSNVYILANVNE